MKKLSIITFILLTHVLMVLSGFQEGYPLWRTAADAVIPTVLFLLSLCIFILYLNEIQACFQNRFVKNLILLSHLGLPFLLFGCAKFYDWSDLSFLSISILSILGIGLLFRYRYVLEYMEERFGRSSSILEGVPNILFLTLFICLMAIMPWLLEGFHASFK